MGYAEKRDGYYAGRYSAGGGRWLSVKDDAGETIRFRTKREAVIAANEEEAKRRQGRRVRDRGPITFGDWANTWYQGLDLAQSTMQNYRHHLEEHLLPAFENELLADITTGMIGDWERAERAAGYLPSSIRTWRTTLSTILGDAAAEDLIDANPAARSRRRGRRTGRQQRRGPEKATTSPLGALLIAERAALLSGRDDEFAAIQLMYWTGLRWGELVGLEATFARPGSLRVEWQLWEDDTGRFHRLPPKDDSYRDIDLPEWLTTLVNDHLAHNAAQPCPCHGNRYLFSGQRSVHPRRSSFSDWIFDPAATGWFPARGKKLPRRPVSIAAEPWPGAVQRGRGNAARATACWLPIAPDLTPHGLRHSHKTLMVEHRVPEILSHERLGHQLEGIGGVYSHITANMRHDLLELLTSEWHAALAARHAMHPTSPVRALDDLLRSQAVRTPPSRAATLGERQPDRLKSRRPAQGRGIRHTTIRRMNPPIEPGSGPDSPAL